MCYFHNVSAYCFSSLGTHQSHHLDGYQAIGISYCFIEAFWAFHFSQPSYHLIISSKRQCLPLICFMTWHIFGAVTSQSRTYFNDHRSFSNAFSHISCVLKWSGTCPSVYSALHTASSHIFCVLRWSGTRPKKPTPALTTPLHISVVFNWLGTYAMHQ